MLVTVVPDIPSASLKHVRYESAVTVQVLVESKVKFAALAVLSVLMTPVRDEPFCNVVVRELIPIGCQVARQ